MRARLTVVVLLALLAVPRVFAQEVITLTTPIVPVTIAGYSPGGLYLTLLPSPHIGVVLVATDGHVETFDYPCPAPCAFTTLVQVRTLIDTLNTANLSIRSLWRRVFDRLVLDFPTRFPGGATVP